MADNSKWWEQYPEAGQAGSAPTPAATLPGTAVQTDPTNWWEQYRAAGDTQAKRATAQVAQPGDAHGALYGVNQQWIDPFIRTITGRTAEQQNAENERIKNQFAQGTAGPLTPQGVYNFETSMAKGVPAAGALVPQTPQQEQFEQEHPVASTVGELTGGVASTLPAFGGASNLAGRFTTAGRGMLNAGRNYLTEVGALGGTGTALNVADTAARKGSDTTPEDLERDAIWGFGSGAIPPTVSRLLSPGWGVPRYTPQNRYPTVRPIPGVGPGPRSGATGLSSPTMSTIMEQAAAEAQANAQSDMRQGLERVFGGQDEWLKRPLYGEMWSQILGHTLGGPMGYLGGAAAPYVLKALQMKWPKANFPNYATNIKFRGLGTSPTTQDILNTLGRRANTDDEQQ